jgi:hypothetical protein
MMKSVIAALAAATAVAAVALPAAAQPAGYGHAVRWDHRDSRAANHLGARLDVLGRRIDDGQRRGVLTRSEAVRLRNEVRAIARVQDRYERGGLSLSERASIDRRLDRLARDVARESHDRDRAYGYGRH